MDGVKVVCSARLRVTKGVGGHAFAVTRHVPTCMKVPSEQHPTIQNTSPILISFRRTGQKMTGTCMHLISNSCRPPTYLRPAANTRGEERHAYDPVTSPQQ